MAAIRGPVRTQTRQLADHHWRLEDDEHGRLPRALSFATESANEPPHLRPALGRDRLQVSSMRGGACGVARVSRRHGRDVPTLRADLLNSAQLAAGLGSLFLTPRSWPPSKPRDPLSWSSADTSRSPATAPRIPTSMFTVGHWAGFSRTSAIGSARTRMFMEGSTHSEGSSPGKASDDLTHLRRSC